MVSAESVEVFEAAGQECCDTWGGGRQVCTAAPDAIGREDYGAALSKMVTELTEALYEDWLDAIEVAVGEERVWPHGWTALGGKPNGVGFAAASCGLARARIGSTVRIRSAPALIEVVSEDVEPGRIRLKIGAGVARNAKNGHVRFSHGAANGRRRIATCRGAGNRSHRRVRFSVAEGNGEAVDFGSRTVVCADVASRKTQ